MSQVVVNTLVYGSLIAIVALGVNLVYGLLQFANFAHVEFATVGSFVAYELTRTGLPLVLAALGAAAITALLATLLHLSIFRRLEHEGANSKMIASVGVAIMLRAAVPLLFGGDAHNLGGEPKVLFTIGGTDVNTLEVAILATTLVMMLGLHVALTRTRLGTAVRATAQNRALAATRGINAERVILLVWAIAGAFAAVAGVFVAMQAQVRPEMGLSLMIPVFAAATVGGLGSAYGAVAGGFLIAFVENVALAIHVGSFQLPTDYKDLVALLVLIAVLLLKPTGLARSATA